MTPLYLLSLIRGLPLGSRFSAEKRGGPQFRGWDVNTYALAAAVNGIRALTHVYISAHSKNKPKPPDPFPIPDSSVRRRKKGPGTFAFIAAQKLAAARRKAE